MKRISIKSAVSVASAEMAFFIKSPKMILIPVFFCYLYSLAVTPLREVASLMGGKLNILEGFVSICNSNLVCLLVAFVFLVLMSAYPEVRGNTLFFLPRCGKTNWIVGQVLFLASSAALYMFAVAAFSLLAFVGSAQTGSDWSNASLLFHSTHPELISSAGANMLTPIIYSQMAPLPAFIHTFFLLYGHLLLLCGIMLLFTVLNRKKLGFVVVYGFFILGIVFSVLGNSGRWAFGVSHAILRLHYHLYLRKPVMPLWGSYLYEYGIFMVLCMIALLRSKNFKTEVKI